MATFILVHGAWVGEWSFDPILSLLEKEHRVYAVSLSGHGNKAHLSNPEITLETHIADVVDFVETRDLKDITLVGHSYGGNVITGAWDRLRDRVRNLVYIDAAIPEEGQSHFDQMGGDSFIKREKIAREHNGMLPFPKEFLKKGNHKFGEWPKDKVKPQSFKTMTTPLQLKNGPLPRDTPKAFILCAAYQSYHHRQAAKIKQDPAWHYFEMNTSHNAMADDPETLARILIQTSS